MALTQINPALFAGATNTTAVIQSNGTTAITVDSSQNVGIGGTPSYKLQVTATASTDGAYITNSSVDGTTLYLNNSSASGRQFRLISTGSGNGPGAGTLGIFDGTANAYRAVIDSAGRVCIGVTSAAYSTACIMNVNVDAVSASGGAWVSKAASTSTAFHMNFQNGNGGVGGISTSGSATQYVTSSDYRLKNSITPMTGALAKIAQLKPVIYKWNSDNSDGEGFIAHELAEVCPHAVTGEKDAIDEEGNPKYQGIDVSFLVATLTAAIQELKAELDTVKAELVALRNK
jgi:hypothetical protein